MTGTTIGSLSATDVDAGDTFTYSLVSGTIGTVRVGEATMAIMDTIIGEVITMAEEEVLLTHTATA